MSEDQVALSPSSFSSINHDFLILYASGLVAAGDESNADSNADKAVSQLYIDPLYQHQTVRGLDTGSSLFHN